MKELVNFLFEVGMLQKTPRSGFQFLGSGRESVAEHIVRTLFVGYVLSMLEPDTDQLKILTMCLFHDIAEARTGDMNYVNKKYVTVDEEKAVRELAEALPFGDDIVSVVSEFNRRETRESCLAHDADQLSFILQLKECGDLGNKYSAEWIPFAIQRLITDAAKTLAKVIVETDSSDWWFRDKNDWWVHANNR